MGSGTVAVLAFFLVIIMSGAESEQSTTGTIPKGQEHMTTWDTRDNTVNQIMNKCMIPGNVTLCTETI